jgi:cation transporter-like permease
MPFISQLKQINQRPKHYWPYYYHRINRNKSAGAKQILFGQIVGVSLSLVAGIFLDSAKEKFILIPGTLLLLPGLIDVIASVTASLSVKINHHIKNTDFKKSIIAVHDALYSLAILMVSTLILSLFTVIVGMLFFEVDPLKIITISMITSLGVGVLAFPLIIIGVIVVRKLKLNPDNIVGPIETSVVDMLVVIIISLVIGVIV